MPIMTYPLMFYYNKFCFLFHHLLFHHLLAIMDIDATLGRFTVQTATVDGVHLYQGIER